MADAAQRFQPPGPHRRRREAATSLGLVREPAQNGGHTIRCLGSRRIVMAFDPATDDTQFLRAAPSGPTSRG